MTFLRNGVLGVLAFAIAAYAVPALADSQPVNVMFSAVHGFVLQGIRSATSPNVCTKGQDNSEPVNAAYSCQVTDVAKAVVRFGNAYGYCDIATGGPENNRMGTHVWNVAAGKCKVDVISTGPNLYLYYIGPAVSAKPH